MGDDGETDATAVVQAARKLGLDLKKLQSDEQDNSVSAAIAAAHTLAGASDIDGTPAFIINGKIREGAINDHILAEMIKS
ncbi:MAG: DsbA family protein, partial [Alphaproteobacteria bacterium]|nr:DsbA family protein [Alphaproteobacteria bacterium]